MATYKVEWKIDLEASSDIDAAMLALEIMKDPNNTAKYFTVTEIGSGSSVKVDLTE